VVYNFVADNMGLSSFVYPLLSPKSEKSRQIQRKFELIAVQDHLRSSILVPTANRKAHMQLPITH